MEENQPVRTALDEIKAVAVTQRELAIRARQEGEDQKVALVAEMEVIRELKRIDPTSVTRLTEDDDYYKTLLTKVSELGVKAEKAVADQAMAETDLANLDEVGRRLKLY